MHKTCTTHGIGNGRVTVKYLFNQGRVTVKYLFNQGRGRAKSMRTDDESGTRIET